MVFLGGRLRVPTRRCDLVVPADWGWGRSNKRKILTLELANKSSTRNAKKLKSQVRSLSDSLKIKKNKSRVAKSSSY